MRVIFFGTPEWAVPSLERLALSAHRIVHVVSQPDRRSSRRGAPQPPPVARRARELGLEVFQPATVRTAEFTDWFRAAGAEAGVVVAYGEILPAGLLKAAPLGFVNVHFSLLPKYRGAAPVQWAIAFGETATGVSTMAIAPRLDAGDVYVQREVEIGAGETAAALGARLAPIGADLLLETLDMLERGEAVRHPQDESKASYAPMLKKEDGAVDWSWEAEVIVRRLRAFDPWPGCASRVRGRSVRILQAVADEESFDETPLAVGTVLGLSSRPAGPPASGVGPQTGARAGGMECLRVLCGEGTVLLLGKLQFEGGRPITPLEALNGRLLAAGDVMGEEA